MYIGAGVLALTAGKMITGEKFLSPYFASNPLGKWLLIGLLVIIVLAAGKWSKMVGYLVEVGDRGQLKLPKELSDEAQIAPEDRFTVKMDSRGKLILVKTEEDENPDETMQHAG